MQFRVPQNIDMEDKIIGPLTLKQFLYLMAGGGLCYAILLKLQPSGRTALAILIDAPIGIFFLALAFVKIQDRPFSQFLLSLLSFSSRPRRRVWRREQEQSSVVIEEVKKTEDTKTEKKNLDKTKVSEITKILDSGGKTESGHGPDKITQ